MKWLVVMAALLPNLSAASSTECLMMIIHSESRGESLEALAITARSAVNRAGSKSKSICSLINKKEVQASRSIPAELRPYFKAIATTALNEKSDIAHGADSWNTGNKPAYHGTIRRKAGKQIFYTMAKAM